MCIYTHIRPSNCSDNRTIEEKIYQRQIFKMALTNQVLAGEFRHWQLSVIFVINLDCAHFINLVCAMRN
jgi:hypothetical protein